MRRIDSNTPKKQHYVPQFILKNFRAGKKKRVQVFDKLRKLAYPSSVRDAACEGGYYNIEIDGEGYTLEGKLASLEDMASTVIRKIVNQETLTSLDAKDLAILHLFCAVQLLRTEHQRNFGKQLQETLLKWLEKRDLNPEDVENFEIQNDQQIKQNHVRNINSLALDFAEHFKNKILMLVKAPHGTEFIISDNPITMHNEMPRTGRGNLGLAVEGIQINMPVSHSLSLTFACPIMMGEIIERVNKLKVLWSFGLVPRLPGSQEAVELVEAIESGRAREIRPENVDFYNSLQVIQSSRFVYSCNGDFSLVEDMLRTNPECQYSPKMESNV
jgi:hypothetical protein